MLMEKPHYRLPRNRSVDTAINDANNSHNNGKSGIVERIANGGGIEELHAQHEHAKRKHKQEYFMDWLHFFRSSNVCSHPQCVQLNITLSAPCTESNSFCLCIKLLRLERRSSSMPHVAAHPMAKKMASIITE